MPIAVRDPQLGSSWRLVSWIDSKATFGDDRIHTRQYEEQYSTYVNRYGPGLVIYWFGCVEGLSCLDPNVAVLEGFPEPADVDVLPQPSASARAEALREGEGRETEEIS